MGGEEFQIPCFTTWNGRGVDDGDSFYRCFRAGHASGFCVQHITGDVYKRQGGSLQIFRKITVPLMLPFVGIGITSTSITAVNVFDEIVALSGMGDLGKNIVVESYLTTFSFLDFGKGSAITYLVMLLAGILGIFYLRSLNREVMYG